MEKSKDTAFGLTRWILVGALVAIPLLVVFVWPRSSTTSGEFRFAEFKQPASTMTHLALTSGAIEKEGLSFTVIPLESGVEVMAALKNPTAAGAHAGNLDYTPIANLIATGQDPVVVAKSLSSWEYVRLVTFHTTGITADPATLRGKKIGRTAGIVGHTYLKRLLALANMSEVDIKAIDGSPTDLAAMLVRGDIDAAVIWAPYVEQMKRNYDRVRAEMTEPDRGEPVEYVDKSLVRLTMALVLPREKLVAERAGVVKFLRALISAEAQLKANPQKVQAQTEEWLGLQHGDLDQFFRTTNFEVVLDTKEVVSSLGTILASREKDQPGTVIPEDLSKHYDASLLRSIDPARVRE